jgi:hypothetical protein
MRTWLSFRTPFRGVRVGVAIPTPAARIYAVSPIGLKVWRVGSTLMLVGLALWLVFSRDQEGRLNENFLLVIGGTLAARWLLKQAVVWLWQPHAKSLEQSTEREAPRD